MAPWQSFLSLFFQRNAQFGHELTAFCTASRKLQGALNFFWKKLPYFFLMSVETNSVGRPMASAGCLGTSYRKLFASEPP
jgi:hypothetical protein